MLQCETALDGVPGLNSVNQSNKFPLYIQVIRSSCFRGKFTALNDISEKNKHLKSIIKIFTLRLEDIKQIRIQGKQKETEIMEAENKTKSALEAAALKRSVTVQAEVTQITRVSGGGISADHTNPARDSNV